MSNNAPDYENNLYFENNKIQATGIDSNKIQANLTEKWVNIYKSKKYGASYWTGTFGYRTKEDAMEDLADKENYLTTINIEEVLKLQEENKRLKHDVGNLGYKIKNQRHEIDNRLKEIEKLKDLLKECRPYISRSATSRMMKNSAGHKKDMKLLTKIDEVLK